MSWERKSSFSHNRYLEEVEKYSKPGSVTEKKAYFEAHFRKKALLRQSSSECQNGTAYQISENGDPQNTGYVEDYDSINEDIHFTHFEESPGGWECDGECEVTGYERESTGVLYSESQIITGINSIDAADSVTKHVKPEEARQSDAEILPKINDEPEIEEDPHEEVLQAHVTSSAIDSSSSGHTAERDDSISSRQHIPSSKVRHLTSPLHVITGTLFLYP